MDSPLAQFNRIFDERGRLRITPYELYEELGKTPPDPNAAEYPTAEEFRPVDVREYGLETIDIYSNPHSEAFFKLLDRMFKLAHTPVNHSVLAQRLHSEMITPHNLCQANIYELECMGLRYGEALLFYEMYEILRCLSHERYGKHPRVGRLEHVTPYMVANFYGMREERFILFFVNHHGRLKRRVELHRGTRSGALFDLQGMLVETLRSDPAGVIMAHNHPGGTLRPSREDLECTVYAINALSTLCIPLLDHLIVAGTDVVSIRDNGYIAESHWLRQHPKSTLLRNWLLPDGESAPRPKKKPAPKKK